MKIILFSIGTRGDMEPFLAIGEMLKTRGHQIICAFPDQFRELAERSGLGYSPLGPESLDVLESKEAKLAFGGKKSKFLRNISAIKMFFNFHKIRKSITYKEYEIIHKEKPDLVFHNALNLYPFIWGFKNKRKSILISAVPYIIHSTSHHPYVSLSRNFGPHINKLTYLITNWGLACSIRAGYRYLKLPKKPSNRKVRQSVLEAKMVYTVSPALFQKPDVWDDNVRVMGFQERDQQRSWNPSEELELFLQRHEKVLFITFGSIKNPYPEEKTQIILNVLEKHHIPAVINTASGGLVEPKLYNTRYFHFVSYIPYDWILPRMYGIIHHGGSGTVHMGLKYGCATMIIPHIFDQFGWNNLITEKGLGPKGIKITRISEKNLEPIILDLYTNTLYKENAEKIARNMSGENKKEELYRFIVAET